MKNTHNIRAGKALLNQRGFTLIEVLIALLVLGVIIVPVSNAFLQSVHLNQHLQQQVAAVREAQTAMEVTLSSLSGASFGATDGHEEICSLLSEIVTSGLLEADTTVEIDSLHEDSPFFVITVVSSYETKDTTGNFTLTSVHLPGEVPWLTPTEYRVVTP